MRPKSKLVLGYILYILLAIAPTALCIGLDWRAYTATPATTVSMSLAGCASLLLVTLQATGHMPTKVKRVVVYGVIAGVLWALKPIVSHLAMLMTAMTAGEVLGLLIAAPMIRTARRQLEAERLGETISKSVEEVIKGRV